MRAIACITILIWGAILTNKNVSGTFCSSGSLSPHTGFCYHVHPEKNAIVEDSRKICRDTYGGDVPSIFSDDENTFIKNLLELENHDYYWIGVNDLLIEDDFRDVMRNERLNYSNWKENEPDNVFSADCAAMERSSGEWVDYSCTTYPIFALGIICQQPPNPNPYTLCPANMLNYITSSGTECYWFSMEKLTALQAESNCTSMGSKLAFIEDQVLDVYLYSYQQSAEMDTLWIGTQQLLDSSGQSYRSVEFGTTKPAYYDNFMSTYSGSETLICAAKIRSEGGKWNQLNCDDGTYNFVCRFNGTETNTSTETTVATTTTISSATPADTTIHTTTEATTPSSTTPTPTITESTTVVPTTTQSTTTIPTTTEPTTPKPTTTEEDTTTLPSTTPTTTHNPTTTAVTTTIPTTYASTTQPFTTDRVTTTTTTTTQATTSETTATSIAISTESTGDTVVDSLLKDAWTLEAVSCLMIRWIRLDDIIIDVIVSSRRLIYAKQE
ncbi:macrophage mannose receptor 1-like isoform X2 [Lytechinus pictus]|uniref:macrophage mannose receptor 1-like isoform X2 n=1 Tax=Lytechinus pictus TaxID=7653 RepID=UPI0030B9C023